jgi:hypothetical protein
MANQVKASWDAVAIIHQRLAKVVTRSPEWHMLRRIAVRLELRALREQYSSVKDLAEFLNKSTDTVKDYLARVINV